MEKGSACMIKKILAWDLYVYSLITLGTVLAFGLFLKFYTDDFNLHMMGGEYIVRTLSIPRIAIGSWYGEAVNLPWVAHEWLSEVLIYSTFHAIGISAPAKIGVVLFFSTIFLFLFLIRNKEYIRKHYIHSLLFCVVSVMAINMYSLIRPQVFGFLTFYGEMWCLVSAWETKKYKRLLFVPVIAMLWANLHGGSSALAYGLPLIFAVCLVTPFSWISERMEDAQASWKEARLYLLVSLFSLVTVCINPYGLEMVRYPFVNMADTNMLKLVVEWLPTNINDKTHLVPCIIPMFFISMTLLLSKRPIRGFDLVFFCIFFLMTMKSARFSIYLNLYAILVLGKYLQGNAIQVFPSEKERIWHGLKFTIVFLFVFALGICYKASSGAVFEVSNDYAEKKDLFRVIEETKPERIWNRGLGDDFLGSSVKPFVDGRADAFTGEPFLVGSLQMPRTPMNEIQKYKFDYLVLQEADDFSVYVRSHPEVFEELYRESSHGVKERPFAF